ncbi:Nramp family divalent metal transporter, partial [Hyphomonas sp.]|uniref:Nramp family divalent metal transporter n=1 Tax=Hyphomonas sp. TaxID=87 RepID=UPI0030FB9435
MKLPIGPGALVAAAFIGPGTVTACTLAGASFGFALVWALVFATLATMILQDMAARLGVMGRVGLGEALVSGTGNPFLKWGAAGLVLAALALGNAAYEAGNLSGGALGLEAIVGEGAISRRVIVLVLAVTAAFVLLIGRYKLIERILVALVILMSLAFAGSAILVRPDVGAMLGGLVPRVPEGGLLTAIALIGTTIVPYNLFLHAASAREHWPDATPQALAEAQTDTRVSVGLGGLISILILTTAAASLFQSGQQVSSAVDMAAAIAPTYGEAARYLVGLGLFAAGLTSSITAPLATAYALSEIAGKPRGGPLFKGVALAILVIGTLVA